MSKNKEQNPTWVQPAECISRGRLVGTRGLEAFPSSFPELFEVIRLEKSPADRWQFPDVPKNP